MPPCNNTALYRHEFLSLLASVWRTIPLQALVREDHSRILIGFKGKLLLSDEEFRTTGESEGLARVCEDHEAMQNISGNQGIT